MTVIEIEREERTGEPGAIERRATFRLAVLVEEELAGCLRRRGRARIDEHLETVLGPVQKEEAPATDAGGEWLHHGQCRGHRNRRIEGVAAGLQNFAARTGGKRMCRGDAAFLCRRNACAAHRGQQEQDGKARKQAGES